MVRDLALANMSSAGMQGPLFYLLRNRFYIPRESDFAHHRRFPCEKHDLALLGGLIFDDCVIG